VLVPVISNDPLAFDLRSTLISCLAALGSVDAAQAHYKTLAALHERELGVPAHSFEEITKASPA
jgi:hypothetical protein